MNSRKRCGSFLLTTALVAANLVAFNVLGSGHFSRLDLTRDKLYTLHPATKELLQGLDDLVTLRVYLSEKRFADNQNVSQIPRVVRDMVEEFVAQSKGRLKATFIDPTDNIEKEQEAETAGIPSVQVADTAKEQSAVFKAFVGIVLGYGGKEDQRIPVAYFQNEEFRLELELDLAIARLTQRATITIGVDSVNEMPEGMPPQLAQGSDKYDIDQTYKGLKAELEKTYQVEKVPVSKPIPDHVQLLVLANTEGLDDKAKYHIDQYLMNGGQMIVLASGVEVDPRMGPAARSDENDEFFRHYGFSIDKNMLFDRQALSSSPFKPPLYWAPYMLERNFNAESTLMTGVKPFALPLSSSIHLNPPEGVTATVLAQTTSLAWQQSGVFSIDPTSPQANPPLNPDDSKSFDTVGLLEGEFNSFFANRKLPEGVGTAVTEPSAQSIIEQMEKQNGGALVPPNAAGDGKEVKKDEHPSDAKADGKPATQGGGNGGALPQDPAQEPAKQEPPKTEAPPTTTPAPAQPPSNVTPAAPIVPPAVQPAPAPAAPPTFVKAKSPKTRIVVVGSSLFLRNDFFQGVPGNAEFFVTLVERMTTGSRLSELRNRTVQRPSIKGDLSATSQLVIKWIGMLGMPAIVAVFGFVSWLVHKRRRPAFAV